MNREAIMSFHDEAPVIQCGRLVSISHSDANMCLHLYSIYLLPKLRGVNTIVSPGDEIVFRQ